MLLHKKQRTLFVLAAFALISVGGAAIVLLATNNSSQEATNETNDGQISVEKVEYQVATVDTVVAAYESNEEKTAVLLDSAFKLKAQQAHDQAVVYLQAAIDYAAEDVKQVIHEQLYDIGVITKNTDLINTYQPLLTVDPLQSNLPRQQDD